MTPGRRRAGALVLVFGTLLSGCDDSAAGFTAGMGRAIGLLLLLGLILPAAVIGLVLALVVRARGRRERRDSR